MSGHDEVLRQFIQSNKSPEGEWWLNLPIGFNAENEGEILVGGTKEIDAVSITSRANSEPDLYQYGQGSIINSDRIFSQSDYRSMWEQGEFSGEHATLVEVKSGAPTWKGVGQLMGYSELIKDNWDMSVSGLYLVAPKEDTVIERACLKLGINVIHEVK